MVRLSFNFLAFQSWENMLEVTMLVRVCRYVRVASSYLVLPMTTNLLFGRFMIFTIFSPPSCFDLLLR
jgi:hypothetical protein